MMMKTIWSCLAAAVLANVIGFAVRANATTIVGDSHVGGLKPFLQRQMHVRFKNGSTARFWLSQHVRDDVGIVMTGTNDFISGVPSTVWLGRTDLICSNFSRCFIVAPPNGAYRQALIGRKNIIWTTPRKTRDGIHFYSDGYRSMANEILRSVGKK